MGLTEAFQDTPPGAKIVYSISGVQVDITPIRDEHSTRVDAQVRTHTHYSGGWTAEGNAIYEHVDVKWVAAQEQVLRDLGIDPDSYVIA